MRISKKITGKGRGSKGISVYRAEAEVPRFYSRVEYSVKRVVPALDVYKFDPIDETFIFLDPTDIHLFYSDQLANGRLIPIPFSFRLQLLRLELGFLLLLPLVRSSLDELVKLWPVFLFG